MKYLSLTVTRLPCYLTAAEPSKWSYQTIMDNVIRRTKSFLRFFDRSKTIGLKAPTKELRIQQNDKLSRKSYLSYFGQSYLRNITPKWSSRSLASALHRGTSKALFRGGCGPVFGFMGFALAKKPSLLTEQDELEGLAFNIREAFSNFSNSDKLEKVPDIHEVSVNDLEFGELLATGCNAAVYSAKWKYSDSVVQLETEKNTEDETIISHSEVEQPCIQNTNLNCKSNLNSIIAKRDSSSFNLATKLMFNYSAESNAFAIFREMYKEALPAHFNYFFRNNFTVLPKSAIPPHLNIVEMHTAFADYTPLLNNAIVSYPQALPTRLVRDGCGRNMTMFLVMKRYHCNLKEYLNNYQPSIQTSLLLFCQLLEGLTHLLQNNIAHRDLKTDNILVDLSNGVSNPTAVITDFGNCTLNLQLPYPSEDIDRGGNVMLMAPEVLSAKAGPFAYIDYSRSDLWTLGTIAYELFGSKNPFYNGNGTCLDSKTYLEENLPELPSQVPVVIRNLIFDMLRRDPKTRPSPSFAATVCQLLLHAPHDLFEKPLYKKTHEKIAHWLFHTSAKTFLEARSKSDDLTVQMKLRFILCQRIFFSELLKALHYIIKANF